MIEEPKNNELATAEGDLLGQVMSETGECVNLTSMQAGNRVHTQAQ